MNKEKVDGKLEMMVSYCDKLEEGCNDLPLNQKEQHINNITNLKLELAAAIDNDGNDHLRLSN